MSLPDHDKVILSVDTPKRKHLGFAKKGWFLCGHCASRINGAFINVYHPRLQSLASIGALTLFSFLSGGLFYVTEHYVPNNLNGMMGLSVNGCVGQKDYWAALAYTNTIITTIGYGNIYTCTSAGRALTVLVALVGIPLVLVSLNNIGKELAQIVESIYRPASRIMRQLWYAMQRLRANAPPQRRCSDEEAHLPYDRAEDVPLVVIASMNVLWILACTLYFHAVEHWTLSEALYCTFITLLTIGFGDYAPQRHSLTVLSYFFIFLGLSFLSASIKLVQQNMERMITRLEHRITNIKRRSIIRRKFGLQYGESRRDINSDPTQIVERLMRKQYGGMLSWLISARKKDALVKQCAKVVMMHESTQTDGPSAFIRDRSRTYHHNMKRDNRRHSALVRAETIVIPI